MRGKEKNQKHVYYNDETNEIIIVNQLAHVVFTLMRGPRNKEVYLGEL